MTKSVVITGVAGFIGRHVAQHLSERGWAIVGIDLVQPENVPLRSLKAYYSFPLPDSRLGNLLAHHAPGLLIHCAGRASVGHSVDDPAADFYDGTVVTFEVLNALRSNAPACRFVLLSSAAVYGNPRSLPVREDEPPRPISPYGFHKWQCEQLCVEFARVYGLATASARVFSAYGAGLRRQVLWDMCERFSTRKSFKMHGTGKESRDFAHVLDIAEALTKIAEHAPMEGEAYNVGSGRQVTIRDLAAMVLDAMGSDGVPEFDGTVPQGVPLNWQANVSKISSLGFIPKISLEQGVRDFVEWFRKEAG